MIVDAVIILYYSAKLGKRSRKPFGITITRERSVLGNIINHLNFGAIKEEYRNGLGIKG